MDTDTALDAGLTDFDLAFAAAASIDGDKDLDQDKGEELPKEEPKEEPPAEELPREEPKPEPEVPKEEPKPEPVKPEVPKAPPVDEVALAAAKAKETEDARLAKEAADKAAADALAREKLTPEEQEIISRTAEDFPDVAKSLQIYERIAMAKAENFIAAKTRELEEKFSQQIAPLSSVAQSYARNSHEAAILGKHPDAFDLLPQVEEWVGSQPSILKNAYNAVLDNGAAKEIIELYDVFKKSTAKESAHSEASSEADIAAAKAKAEADAEKERKLKAQEGVKSRQSSQKSSEVDENDFEGAFQMAAANK